MEHAAPVVPPLGALGVVSVRPHAPSVAAILAWLVGSGQASGEHLPGEDDRARLQRLVAIFEHTTNHMIGMLGAAYSSGL